MNIFIICSVRDATPEYREKLENYVAMLESKGHKVHLPHRDTNQNATGLEICTQNMNAIKNADEVRIFYSKNSQGSHFDMGVSFALDKKIEVVESERIGSGKSFQKMLREWHNKQIKDQLG